MKKEYIRPELNIVELDKSDIIITSGCGGGDNETGVDPL